VSLAALRWLDILADAQAPAQFAGTMAKMPVQAMMLFPFETLWTRARAGPVVVGDPAPDFQLPTLDKKSWSRLPR